MAQFKKVPGDKGPINEITEGSGEVLGQFAMTYWPLVLGGILLFLLIVLGYERVAIPVAFVVLALQAWILFG